MKCKPAQGRAFTVRLNPVTAAVAVAVSGIAGTADAGSHTRIMDKPELVVSATRRDTGIQDVPFSISALSGERIRREQIRDLSDIARRTPGLFQVDQGSREANRLVIRGINADDIAAPELLRNTQGDRVGTYLAETPVYVDIPTTDLERVEVLRGPQGTLFGARALGGVVRFIPRSPSLDETTIEAAAGHATDDLDTCAERSARTTDEWIDLLQSTGDLTQSVRYQNTSGTPFENELQDLAHHVVNHGTHHRAQIAQTLRQSGESPPATDYIYFLRDAEANTRHSLHLLNRLPRRPST